ncbi:hypothetical protein ACIQZO_04935 [Streptomyces sp. NPDC097617]|uniref:hypothetical protein n=1 Tax=Streptomyces sp. NPDC097617 TaxID=3366091 RepID=UPI00382070F9
MTPPCRSYSDVRTAVLLLIVGLIVSQLAVRVRRLEGLVTADGSHLSRLEETGRLAEDGGCGSAWSRARPQPPTGRIGGRTARASCAPSAAPPTAA